MKKNRLLDLPEDVLDALKRLVGPQPLMTLLNDYQGVAITSEARLQGFDLNTATFRVHKHQAVCLALEKQTRLQSRTLSLAVQARVATLDIKNSLARLTDFKPVAYTTERRLTVQPDPPHSIEIELSIQNWTTHGHLETVSLTSLNIFLPASEIFFEPELVFREDAALHARLQLPGADRPITFAANVLHGAPQQDDYTVSLRLTAEGDAQKAIREYILRRRVVVAQELEKRYEQMIRNSSGPDQM